MASTLVLPNQNQDQFFREVQHRLVGPMRLANVVVSVERHEGRHVATTISPLREHSVSSKSKSRVRTARQLTPEESAEKIPEIDRIVRELLADCGMQSGEITFVVCEGVLIQTTFSYAKSPNRSPYQPEESHQREWTNEKNRRRCELVDKEIAGTILPEEGIELEKLQSEMLAYRRKVAPLPLSDLRELHEEWLQEFSEKPE